MFKPFNEITGEIKDCAKQGTVLFQDTLTLDDVKQVDSTLNHDDLLGIAQHSFSNVDANLISDAVSDYNHDKELNDE